MTAGLSAKGAAQFKMARYGKAKPILTTGGKAEGSDYRIFEAKPDEM